MPPKKPTAQKEKAEKKDGDAGKKAGGSKSAKSNQAGGSNDAEASGSSGKVSCLSFSALEILLGHTWTLASQVEGSDRGQREVYPV